jgi:diguanylate cyclase (GGDEF)-like protein/PAS domain S-box-containing protein
LKISASLATQQLPELLKMLGAALLFAALSKLTLTFLAGNGVISTIWPPSGLGLAMVLIGGPRYAASIFLGTFLLNILVTGNPFIMSAGLAAAPSMEALLGSWLLTRGGQFEFDFVHLRDLLRLILLAGFVSVVIGALIGTSTLLVSGFVSADSYFQSLRDWWMGDTLGIILLTPFILVWQRPPREWSHPRRMVELVVILGLTFLAGQVIFLGWLDHLVGLYARAFFMYLFIAIAAIRLGPHGVMTVLIMVAVQAMMGALHGVGYFASDIASTHLVNYWLYMVTTALVGIMLATYIAAEKQDKETLREQEEFFHMITENIDDFIAVLDLHGRRLYNSPSYAKLFGDPRSLLNTDSFAEVHPDDREHVKAAFRETVRSGEGQRIEFRFVLADGSVRYMESRGGLISNNMGEPLHVVVVSHDITERKKIDEKIRSLAFYDALTDLPNRRMLDDRLGQAMAASKRSGKYGAVLFLDLDNFKPLNDQYGHHAGDLLLIEVARRITSCVREVDTVARFGGDEFVVMISSLESDRAESVQQAEIVAEKIRVALAEPYQISIKAENDGEIQVEHRCTTSIGVVLFIDHEASAEDILKWADMAMYRAKDEGRNRIRRHQ